MDWFLYDNGLRHERVKTSQKGIRVLLPTKMLQRLPIALAQVQAGNRYENLPNEIRQIVYSLYQAKRISKTVYNTLLKSLYDE